MTGSVSAQRTGEGTAQAALKATLSLRHLESAARYLHTNMMTLPLIIVGLAALLHQWFAWTPLILWSGATVASWSMLMVALTRFLKDPDRARNLAYWRAAICAGLFIAVSVFVAVAPLFWVQDDRLNNVLMYVLTAAGLASAAAQSAPSSATLASNVVP